MEALRCEVCGKKWPTYYIKCPECGAQMQVDHSEDEKDCDA